MDSCITRLLTFLFLTLGVAYALASYPTETRSDTLTGKVFDVSLDAPLPYVNLLLLDQNRKTLTGAITDENGLFKLVEVPEGKHILSV